MNKRRLLKLADLLEADAKNVRGIKFDMDWWGTVNNQSKPMSCGTSACALGLAAMSGAFKRAGLGYRIDHNDNVIITLRNRAGPFRAARGVFNLTYDEAEELFIQPSSKGARGERAVAKRIRDFVAGKSIAI